MAKRRTSVGSDLKARLRVEAGRKCANPGCPVARTQIHHIREWAVYETHDQRHMIAVCPTCHDAIHHGEIELSDDTVYAWKSIRRETRSVRGHLYVEPGDSARLFLGSLTVGTTKGSVSVFDITPGHKLQFKVQGGDILLLDLRMTDLQGKEVISIDNGYVKYQEASDIEYRSVSGSIEVSTTSHEKFVPRWVCRQMESDEPGYLSNGVLTLLSIRVVSPGLVRVKGVWARQDAAFIITDERLVTLVPTRPPLSFCGEGDKTTILWDGPITSALFPPGVESA